jgi:hypothetical protein
MLIEFSKILVLGQPPRPSVARHNAAKIKVSYRETLASAIDPERTEKQGNIYYA